MKTAKALAIVAVALVGVLTLFDGSASACDTANFYYVPRTAPLTLRQSAPLVQPMEYCEPAPQALQLQQPTYRAPLRLEIQQPAYYQNGSALFLTQRRTQNFVAPVHTPRRAFIIERPPPQAFTAPSLTIIKEQRGLFRRDRTTIIQR